MIGVVLAGGASTRFGGRPKGLVPFAGRPMALHVADLLSQFCSKVAIETVPGLGYEALGFPLVEAPKAHAGKGPLAGIAAGLGLASTGDRVAFAPCDMPRLTRDIYDDLAAEGQGAYAISTKGVEPLVAVLNATMRAVLVDALAQAHLPRTHAVLDAAGARQVAFADAAQFQNINSQDDLDRALRLNSASPPPPQNRRTPG